MTVRILLLTAEALLLALFLIAFPVINLGNITGILVSLILMLITVRFGAFKKLISRLWSSTGGKIGIIAVLILLAVFICFGCFCTVRMLSAFEKPADNASAVVVLGCQVKGERPSKMLRRRLDAAIGCLKENPELPCIVSGGKGSDEAISEALCMKNYLAEQGIPESRIIMEDKSTSTDENLEFSFKILDDLGLDRNIILVTDGYHQYRAQLKAKKHGAGSVGSVSAETELRFIPTYWVREWIAIAQEMFLS